MLGGEPKKETQALFLATMSSQILAKQNYSANLKRTIAGYKDLIYSQEEIDGASKLSEALRALKFNPLVVTMAEVGESSGQLGETLREASRSLIYQLKLKEELGKDMRSGLVYLVIGLVMFMVISLGFAPLIKGIMNEPGLRFDIKLPTRIMLNTHAFITTYWPFLVIAIGVVTYWRNAVWRTIRVFPLLRTIWMVQLLTRGIHLLAAYRPLFRSGITSPVAIELIMHGMTGDNKLAYKDVSNRLGLGLTLSNALDSVDWPTTLRQGMVGFEGAKHDVKESILESLTEVMILQQRINGRKVAKVALVVGMFAAVASILLMVFGAVFPLQQIRAV
jgi:type II secretory pathway component PulF